MTKGQRHEVIYQKIKRLYDTKNADYNDSFAQARKEVPCYTLGKLYDKFSRFKHLSINGENNQVISETIEDTLLDLANYAMMELVERSMGEVYTPEEVKVEGKVEININIDPEEDYEDDEELDLGGNELDLGADKDLSAYNKTSLVEVAKALGLKVNKKMSREVLVSAIESKPKDEVEELLEDLFGDGNDED